MVEPSESETFDSAVASILAFTTPSLLLIPNGRSNGKMFSLLPNDGSGDFVFTGIDANGGRTRVNKAGNVEIVRRNLLPNSTTQSVWAATTGFTRTNVNIKNNKASNLLVTATQNGVDYQLGLKYTNLGAITLVSGLTYTISFRFKPNDGNGNCAYYMYTPAEIGASFNVFTGVTSGGYSGNCTKLGRSITHEGNGIYLVSETFTMTANVTLTTATLTLGFAVGISTQATGRNADFGTPQLELSSVPTSYQESDSGVSIPRLDYSSGNASVLLEPQRTNIVFWSNNFLASGWIGQGATIVEDPSVASPFLGQKTYKVSTTNNGYSGLYRTLTGNLTNVHTMTVYVKRGNVNFVALVDVGGLAAAAWYNIQNGTLGTVNAGYSATITPAFNGFYKLTLTRTGANQVPVYCQAMFTNTNGSTTGVVGDSYVAYMGIEVGSFDTSPIVTETASKTRVADNLSANIPLLLNQGTFFVNLRTKAQGQSNSNLNIFLSAASDGFSGDGFWIRNDVTTLMFPKIFRRQGGATTAIYTLTAVENDIAIAWDGVNVVLYVNGVQIGSPIPFTTTALNFFNVNPNIIQEIGTIMFFNQRLTNDELAALTTL